MESADTPASKVSTCTLNAESKEIVKRWHQLVGGNELR